MKVTACKAAAYFFPDFVRFTLGGVKLPFCAVINAIGTKGKK